MSLTREALRELTRIVGGDGVVTTLEGRLTYECDMHTFYKGIPDVVVLPRSSDQIVDVVRLCLRERIPLVPRGSGTGLIGGATAPLGGVMVSTTRMCKILEVDLPNRCATVEPGVINLRLTDAVKARGYFFAPDPSSQLVSSIGGNASTNAGGPHCLKYGITVNHVLGLEMVTGMGEIVRLGGKVQDPPGYDLTAAVVGSEGTLGILTKIIVRLLHTPEAVKTLLAAFSSIEDATETVSDIIAQGVLPAALELMDQHIIQAVEEGIGAGYPKGAGAVLLIELDGPQAEVESQALSVAGICRTHAAIDLQIARDDAERALLWKGRKEAAGAFGRLTPNWLLQDAVVPRSKLPQIVRELLAISTRYGILIGNIFHAGDGNLHPLICYDERRPGELDRAIRANDELLRACIALGGTVTGEHGVGLDKAKNLPLQYSETDLRAMAKLRQVFDSEGIMNPGKLLPSHPACGEAMRPPGQKPLLPGAWI